MSIISESPLCLEADLVRDSTMMPDEFELGTFQICVGELPDNFDFSSLASADELAEQSQRQTPSEEPTQANDKAVPTISSIGRLSTDLIEGDFKPARFYWVEPDGTEINEFELPVIQVVYNAITGTAVVVVPARNPVDSESSQKLTTTYYRLKSPNDTDWTEIDYFEYNDFKLNNSLLSQNETPDESIEEQIEREKAVHAEAYERANRKAKSRKDKLAVSNKENKGKRNRKGRKGRKAARA